MSRVTDQWPNGQIAFANSDVHETPGHDTVIKTVIIGA